MWSHPNRSEYENKVLSNWEIKAKIPKRFSDAGALQTRIPDVPLPEFNQSFYYWGEHGTGKTTWGCYLLYKLATQEVQDHPGSTFPGLFLPAVELYEELRNCYSGKKEYSAEDVLNEYSRVPYLVLDDIGREKTSRWTLEKVFILVDRRYRDMLPTIFLSNLSIENLYKTMGSGISRRIMDIVSDNVLEI